MKWPVVALLLTGIIAAVCAGLLIMTLTAPPPEGEQAPGEENAKVEVVVATQNLPEFKTVTEEMLSTTAMPVAEAKSRGSYYTEKSAVIGLPLVRPVEKGQVLTFADFSQKSAGTWLASELKDGERAMQVILGDAERLSGLLYKGARVDILASFRTGGARTTAEAVADTVLQDIRVLALDTDVVGYEKPVAEGVTGEQSTTQQKSLTVTLAVTLEQAKSLDLAMKHGQPTLILRNPLDSKIDAGEAVVLSTRELTMGSKFMQPVGRLANQGDGTDEPGVVVSTTQPVSSGRPSDASPLEGRTVTIFRGVTRQDVNLNPDEQ